MSNEHGKKPRKLFKPFMQVRMKLLQQTTCCTSKLLDASSIQNFKQSQQNPLLKNTLSTQIQLTPQTLSSNLVVQL